MLTALHSTSTTRLIQLALLEDIQTGDITTETTIPIDTRASAEFLCKMDGVICGLPVCEMVFASLMETMSGDEYDRSNWSWKTYVDEGQYVHSGTVIATIEAPANILLQGERTALNFLQRMSGVASMANRFVKAVEGTGTKILDTRKTIPGWRLLDKYAAQCGGAVNHRHGLYDMVMIKDNHILAAGGIVAALERCSSLYAGGTHRIEIETASLEDVATALSCGGFHRIMFDNFNLDSLRLGVRNVAGQYETEASGGITLETVRSVAETGVEYISTGAITHSAPALDISLDITLAL